MLQTAYTGIKNLYKGVPYLGGICKFWYIPIDEVDHIPAINPETQYLFAEPELKADKVWRGPVPVPDAQLGFTETQDSFAGMPFYKQKVAAQSPGDVPQQRVNLENMAYGQYLVVAKLRAGGFYILLGSMDSPMDFDSEFTTGPGANENAKNKLAFTGESNFKALVIPEFQGDESGYVHPCDGGGGGGGATGNETEIISFADVSSFTVSWTPTRQARFGAFPEVEVYLKDDTDTYYKAAVQPYVDNPPPGFTTMYFNFSGDETGFILIK